MLIKENDDRLQELAKELGNSDEYRIIGLALANPRNF